MIRIFTKTGFGIGILIFIMWAATMNAQVQPFGEAGSEWYLTQKHYPFAVFHIYHLKPTKVYNTGDTIIQDKNCQKLYMEKSEPSIAHTIFGYAKDNTLYVHNDSGKIYYFDHFVDKFKLLFDFNAEPEEMWTAAFPCDDTTIIFGDPSMVQDSVNLTVTEIDWLETDGPALKQIHTNSFSPIVERIGWLGNFLYFYDSYCQHLGHNDAMYLCSYYDPEVGLIKFYDHDCTQKLIITSTSDVDLAEFGIHPNPTSDYFSIQLPWGLEWSDNLQIELFNGFGQIIHTYSVYDHAFLVGHLPKGIYWVSIKSNDYLFKPQKLVVQ